MDQFKNGGQFQNLNTRLDSAYLRTPRIHEENLIEIGQEISNLYKVLEKYCFWPLIPKQFWP